MSASSTAAYIGPSIRPIMPNMETATTIRIA